MIIVKHVAKSFSRQPVLRDVSFDLATGEFVGMVGPSGGGKSVLLKILGKVIEPSAGEIRYTTEGGDSRDLTVGFLFQEGALFDSMTVLENVRYPLASECRSGKESALPECSRSDSYDRAYEILKEVGLAKAYAKIPGQLSGGMRRRVALARALVHRPQLVLLDDPTGGLDPVAASVIIDLIKELHRNYGPTVVMVSHDIRRLLPNVNRVLALFDGVIALDTVPEKIEAEARPDVLHFLATRYDFGAHRSVPTHPVGGSPGTAQR